MNPKPGWANASRTLELDGRRVTLESRAFQLGWSWGGLIWNRPVAVLVRDGSDERCLPIHDVTRRRQVALYALSALLVIAGLLAGSPAAKE